MEYQFNYVKLLVGMQLLMDLQQFIIILLTDIGKLMLMVNLNADLLFLKEYQLV
jgi:hypothetical protein